MRAISSRENRCAAAAADAVPSVPSVPRGASTAIVRPPALARVVSAWVESWWAESGRVGGCGGIRVGVYAYSGRRSDGEQPPPPVGHDATDGNSIGAKPFHPQPSHGDIDANQ